MDYMGFVTKGSQPAAAEEVFEMAIGSKRIDVGRSTGKMNADGGDFPMASQIHEPNGTPAAIM